MPTHLLPTIERDDHTIPLAFAYAEDAAGILFVTTNSGDTNVGVPGKWTRTWVPRYPPPNEREGHWEAQCSATAGSFTISTRRSRLHCFLSQTAPPVARAMGENFLESDLERLLAAWMRLPQGKEVCRVVIEKLDWMDANPMYRGIPVKQNKTAARKQGARDS